MDKTSTPPLSSESHRSTSPPCIDPTASRALATGRLGGDRECVDTPTVGAPSLTRPLCSAPALTKPCTPWPMSRTAGEPGRADPSRGLCRDLCAHHQARDVPALSRAGAQQGARDSRALSPSPTGGRHGYAHRSPSSTASLSMRASSHCERGWWYGSGLKPIKFIPLSFWYDAPLTSRDGGRRHDPWLVYGLPSYRLACWSSWIVRA